MARATRAGAGEREFDIGEGGGGIVVQGVGLEPEFGLRFARAGEGGGEIDEGGRGIADKALRPRPKDERGGVSRWTAKKRIEGADRGGDVGARKMVAAAGVRERGIGGGEVAGAGEITGGVGPMGMLDEAGGAAQQEFGSIGREGDEFREVGDVPVGAGMGDEPWCRPEESDCGPKQGEDGHAARDRMWSL